MAEYDIEPSKGQEKEACGCSGPHEELFVKQVESEWELTIDICRCVDQNYVLARTE